MSSQISVNIDSYNDLSPGGITSLSKQMLTYCQLDLEIWMKA